MIDWQRIPLHDREAVFSFLVETGRVELEACPYAVLWEDPADPDAPVRVTVASDTWFSMARHGGILPPVWVYHELARDAASPDFAGHRRGRGSLLHTTPAIGPLSPEAAIEYLIEKDIPPQVWRDYRGNRQIMRIVPVHAIPTDRKFRDAWRIRQIRSLAA